MQEYLEKSNLQGPFSNVVDTYFKKYSSLAEQAFEQGDYDAAQWWWSLLDKYWRYVSRLRPCRFGGGRVCGEDDELWEVLRRSNFTCHEGLLKLVKACLRQLRYREADRYIDDALCRTNIDGLEIELFGSKLAPFMETKLQLCACLALTARGAILCGVDNLEAAVSTILSPRGPRILENDISLTELIEDLRQTIDNQLIRMKSLRRLVAIGQYHRYKKAARNGKLAW
jgi:hypothetical protein